MNILDLALEAGLNLKRASSSKGGVYRSPCPSCGGNDRFHIWPEQGRFWCRKCDVDGDTIQFCRDFMGMTFQEAKERVGEIDRSSPSCSMAIRSGFGQVYDPSATWIEKAEEFVESCHQRLLLEPAIIEELRAKRGLTLETIRMHRLGWNPIDRFYHRPEWGVEEKEGKKGKKMCLPKGFVIPSYDVLGSASLCKIKIRRADWEDGDKWEKYHEVEGGSKILALYGFLNNQVAMLVESEFDAMLVNQETQGFCICVALGGAGKRPDAVTADWLKSRKLVLYSLDFDRAGDIEYGYWASSFPNLGRWRPNSEKSPADSYVLGKENLLEWFLAGREYWCNKFP